MTGSLSSKLRRWLSPVVYLSTNWISRIGVLLATSAGVLWIFLLPTLWSGTVTNPYAGILLFMMLPGGFFAGLILIPIGIYVEFRRHRRKGDYPTSFPPLDLKNRELRRLGIFVVMISGVNAVIAGQLSYSAVNYMDSVEFCGQTCHTVMKPEFTAYQNSPHSRVECVKCHIGPGASWFVRSKLSGAYQVYAVAANVYERPIPTPVRNLRPARETCENCHWPQKYGGDRLQVISKFAADESNSRSKTALLMHIGGGGGGEAGIHGVHLGRGVVIRYAQSDESRQTIPWVEYTGADGKPTTYVSSDAKAEDVAKMAKRVMDCMDCHNRPSHTFELPDRALDKAMANGEISPGLPWIKKQATELLKKPYATEAQAAAEIPAGLERFYQEKYPAIYSQHRTEITRSAQAVLGVFNRNVFPEMRITWGSYPNNLGHTDFPGCFRCHDGSHVSKDKKAITQDCASCHNVLAVEEPQPKILNELGFGTDN